MGRRHAGAFRRYPRRNARPPGMDACRRMYLSQPLFSAVHQYLLLASTFALIFALGVASTAVFSYRLMGGLMVGVGMLMAAVR